VQIDNKFIRRKVSVKGVTRFEILHEKIKKMGKMNSLFQYILWEKWKFTGA